MRTRVYDHLGGRQYMPDDLVSATLSSLEGMSLPVRKGGSASARTAILNKLRDIGWSSPTRIDAQSKITVTAMCNGTALALQTGNTARFYADLLKLQALYLSSKSSSAVYILFCSREAKKIGSNIANFERLVDELVIFQKTITVPMLVIGLEE